MKKDNSSTIVISPTDNPNKYLVTYVAAGVSHEIKWEYYRNEKMFFDPMRNNYTNDLQTFIGNDGNYSNSHIFVMDELYANYMEDLINGKPATEPEAINPGFKPPHFAQSSKNKARGRELGLAKINYSSSSSASMSTTSSGLSTAAAIKRINQFHESAKVPREEPRQGQRFFGGPQVSNNTQIVLSYGAGQALPNDLFD